ncbi:alpha-amylase-like [Gigantopelta aegis]|uniref:alpha-amylase-like n=1 Tax=Gigantopelta aegis TaxID=1735272 RepID=UPI001B88C1C0|nr:alpha-amylase-like [Gigantopelta aegis]
MRMLWTALIHLVLPAVLISGEFTDPHCSGKQVIVHLFEWKWTAIAEECERFLSNKGFCGVQVSPPNEHVVVHKEYERPWWERYQPVSYNLTSRSGTEAEFTDMVHRCKAVGVRIYVDAVVNHMAGIGRSGVGTAGSHFDSDARDFPGVPYSRQHFNDNHDKSRCHSTDGYVNNYADPLNVRNCFLVGLTDLDQSQAYVQDKIAGYFNHLIDIGVAGFRIDAAKHMWPGDIRAIQDKTKNLPEGGKTFFYHEVIDQNDGAVKVNEYIPLGYVSEFRFCQKIAWGTRDFGRYGEVIDYGWGMTPSDHAFVFVDNHDNQRGHGGGGNQITHKTPRDYKFAVAFMLAYNYGFTRIMSSYFFDNTDQGPPADNNYMTKDVPIKADGSCGNGWVCEHRWDPIANMVAFRNAVVGTDIQHWYDDGNIVAFARGDKGFFVQSKNGNIDQTFITGLPAGQYCDLIHDCQQKITVDGSGRAHIRAISTDEPIVAFVTGGPGGPIHFRNPTPAPGTSHLLMTGQPLPTAPSSFTHTVILVEKQTAPGQDLFIRGGIDHNNMSGCSTNAQTSACAIPIRHRQLGSSLHFAKVNVWSVGDSHLDWYGTESGQGSYRGRLADGTPALWTTNRHGHVGHSSYNRFGDHYWLVGVDMDCSRTRNGFFEVKAIVNGVWEHDGLGGRRCSGVGAADPPYSSANHWARCGFVNIFHFGSERCEIDPLTA